jgi:serine/threonine-protein kinase HSL1 (negative regulator of Swe1 kinase)
MPDILKHPFFISRSPRPIPGRQLVSPPSLGEVERPVNSPEEIDADIMGNLKTLWHGVSDDEIVAALMSREYVSYSSNPYRANVTQENMGESHLPPPH